MTKCLCAGSSSRRSISELLSVNNSFDYFSRRSKSFIFDTRAVTCNSDQNIHKQVGL
ncbi:hypothetical protein [uncultured Flavobacterium sp.]|uniref:hypothetical protein n=1 Tax=uncultured Flavobacterium sp. TaxID=165435 RepID=UPI000A8E446B|nr:hypothetical protein [uncultured Flavobacterium sp.]